MIDKHSKVIENEKLKALGKRNQLYEEIESREKREQELKVLIREKREELERLKSQSDSLLKIETEQKMLIEKLSNNVITKNPKKNLKKKVILIFNIQFL